LGGQAGSFIGNMACGGSLPSLESLEGPIGVDGPVGGGGGGMLIRPEMC
jgi:hypothetical protein